MNYFRKLIACRKLVSFLAFGMLLRSIVAVGFMLDTNPADGSLLSIAICEGPAGINAIAGLDEHSNHHANHNNKSVDDSGKHEHATQDHPISSCNFWSSSSNSQQADVIEYDLSNSLLSYDVAFYQGHNVSYISFYAQYARAPPS